MKKIILLLLGLSCLQSLCAQGVSNPEIVEGDILVRVYDEEALPQIIEDLSVLRGQPTGLRLTRQLSAHMKIWQLRFDYTQHSHEAMLQALLTHRRVQAAQLNRVLENRATVPNDPNFGQQWQYINTGQGGGTPGADIDADLAWDITTGGVTALGDTIVVCVIDDGLNLNHLDIAPNRWYNHNEIPGNGIDDDGNGFVDDVLGWNAYNNNDNIAGGTGGGGHGTPVAGIIGAKGDNGIGVAGVNWNVKLMIVVGGGNEAQAIAAYAYPLETRKLYNQTNGALGAFVVATNASWGVDFAQASTAPLWCAMYDTLGVYGVLNAGATTNSNTNVDVQGDLPTSCPSDYLISVTNMNRNDLKVNSAGYGAITIDLGAPGEGTHTAAAPNTYGGFGGTSGATPHVTGAIALLYSAPCPRLAAQAKSDPEATAATVRNFILQGVDTIPSLVGITTTGGRLNLHKSLLLAMQSGCALSGCYQPYGLHANQVTDSSFTLSWVDVPDASLGYLFRYRALGDTTWTSATAIDSFAAINGLMPCTSYEVQVAADCDTLIGNYTNSFIVKTGNCCLAPVTIATDSVASNEAYFSWAADANVAAYTIEYQLQGSGIWQTVSSASSTIVVPGLDSCAHYQLRILSACAINVNNEYSPTLDFRTKGCGNCEDLVYCDSEGADASYEWISNVTVGSINNNSGAAGYEFFKNASTQLTQGQSYPISLTLSIDPPAFPNWRWKLWIDYDQNGEFEANELAFSSGAISTNTFTTTATIDIPTTALLGNTRMRVSMRWGQDYNSCSQFNYGEVEDYCVEIIENPTRTTLHQELPAQILLFPNPVGDRAQLQINSPLALSNARLLIVDISGRVWREQVYHLNEGQNYLPLHTEDWPKGLYWLSLQNEEGIQFAPVKLVR